MTNHHLLYTQAKSKLALLPKGIFRFSDICDNPPTRLGLTFRDDVVKNKCFADVKCIGFDRRSTLYQKL